ncbi:MAG: hypothetical protein K8R85_10130 [Bacteroidetes bacterium]|nr:hypothetical protein [Bacteroidota bacterium]
MKQLLFVALFCIISIFNGTGYAQDAKVDATKDRDWAIEVEPSGFLFRGYGVQVTRNVTKDNLVNIGLYSAALDIPDWAKEGIFQNVTKETDVRLGFELALVARYKIKIGQKESNPYIGFIGGWEYFDIAKPLVPKVRISTFVATPMFGYEIYLFKQMLYINPQVRGVFYLAPDSDQPNRTEAIETFFVLPTLSIGIKL